MARICIGGLNKVVCNSHKKDAHKNATDCIIKLHVLYACKKIVVFFLVVNVIFIPNGKRWNFGIKFKVNSLKRCHASGNDEKNSLLFRTLICWMLQLKPVEKSSNIAMLIHAVLNCFIHNHKYTDVMSPDNGRLITLSSHMICFQLKKSYWMLSNTR